MDYPGRREYNLMEILYYLIKEGGKDMKKYKCLMCGYVYNPAVGDQDNGIEAGTAFEDLPDGWLCPECGADKGVFELVND